jgi:3-oxoacyl-[acyl-carrier-protein] synthase-3
MVDTSDEWIISRTGIKERRIASDDEPTSDLSKNAALKALEMAGAKPEEIDLLMVATVTPDYRCPSASCIVQEKLGLINSATMDIVAACAGFLHSLATADAFIKIGKYKKILIIGVEKLSSITNYKDRNTCVLFGDAAGAAVIEPTTEDRGVMSTFLKSNGRHAQLLWIPGGGSVHPYNGKNDLGRDVYLHMNGKEVFKHAVREMEAASRNVINEVGLDPEEIKIMIPHQANIRIIESTAKRLGISMDKVYLNLPKYGNTSAASVPLALDEALQEGRVKEGDIVLMTAFGGGLTWASALMKW